MKWFRLLLLWLSLSLIGALLFEVLASEPGRVIVSAGGKIYSMRLVVFVALWLLLWFVLWALGWLITWPLRRFRKQALRAGRIRLANGLQALREGRFARAQELLEKAGEIVFQREAALHAAREAALAQENYPRAAQYLEQIRLINPDDAVLHEAEEALMQSNAAQVLQLLPLNLPVKQSNPRALELQCRALLKMGKALQAHDHLHEFRQKLDFAGPRLWQLEKQIAQGLIEECPADALVMHWNTLSAPLKEDVDVLRCYLQRRMQDGETHSVLTEIVMLMHAQWRPGLLKAFSAWPNVQIAHIKSTLEEWLGQFPNEPSLHLLLARCQLQAGEKELALTSVEHAISLHNSREAQLVLGEVQLARGNHAAMRQAYERALQLS